MNIWQRTVYLSNTFLLWLSIDYKIGKCKQYWFAHLFYLNRLTLINYYASCIKNNQGYSLNQWAENKLRDESYVNCQFIIAERLTASDNPFDIFTFRKSLWNVDRLK
jgi:hypothetical protein